MNTGQMMITLGAMILLSVIILRVTSNFVHTDVLLMESKFGVLGVSLATSMMEEAKGRSFDDKSDSGSVLDHHDLTAIGPETGKSFWSKSPRRASFRFD